MSWPEWKGYLTIRHEEDRAARKASGDDRVDPDVPARSDPRYGRPPGADVLKHVPWEHGDPDLN